MSTKVKLFFARFEDPKIQKKIDILTDYELRGLISKKECFLPVLVGRVGCLLIDEFGNKTKRLNILAYLPFTSEIPLILGFKTVLEKFELYVNYAKDEAWIEEMK
ncbi:MAG: hypothetical protein ACE5K0_03310 [Candidatus Methanofastidiosia archaeon]